MTLYAAAVSFPATGLRAANAGTTPFAFLLVSGAPAGTVLVLPAASGSFVLLALGSWYVIGRVRGLTACEIGDSVLPRGMSGMDVVLELATVRRLISWLLARLFADSGGPDRIDAGVGAGARDVLQGQAGGPTAGAGDAGRRAIAATFMGRGSARRPTGRAALP